MNQRRSPCDQYKLTAQVKEHLTLTRHTYVMCSLSLSLSAPILSISTCSNTRVAPHLEVTAEKIRSDNCILSLHIILEPQKVNFSWIFINHRRIQTTCYVPLWCLQLFFYLLHFYDGDRRPKAGSICSKNTIMWCTTSAKNH